MNMKMNYSSRAARYSCTPIGFNSRSLAPDRLAAEGHPRPDIHLLGKALLSMDEEAGGAQAPDQDTSYQTDFTMDDARYLALPP
jgi:hypothetical protein